MNIYTVLLIADLEQCETNIIQNTMSRRKYNF